MGGFDCLTCLYHCPIATWCMFHHNHCMGIYECKDYKKGADTDDEYCRECFENKKLACKMHLPTSTCYMKELDK